MNCLRQWVSHELTRKNTKRFAAQMAVCDSLGPRITRINTDLKSHCEAFLVGHEITRIDTKGFAAQMNACGI